MGNVQKKIQLLIDECYNVEEAKFDQDTIKFFDKEKRSGLKTTALLNGMVARMKVYSIKGKVCNIKVNII